MIVPPPRRGIDVANTIFKCLQICGIENKLMKCCLLPSKFKDVFPGYKEREPHYNYLPSSRTGKKLTRVEDVIDVAANDKDEFMRQWHGQ